MLDNFSNIEIILSGVLTLLLVLSFLLWRKLGKLEKFQKKFFAGTAAQDLEEIILRHKDEIAQHSNDLDRVGRFLENFTELQKLNIQKLGLVRFNPYSGEGGNNSFALAILDGKNNGAVISSLYGRDSQRIYAKPIVGGQSEIPLTEEEKEAILRSQGLTEKATDKKTPKRLVKKASRN